MKKTIIFQYRKVFVVEKERGFFENALKCQQKAQKRQSMLNFLVNKPLSGLETKSSQCKTDSVSQKFVRALDSSTLFSLFLIFHLLVSTFFFYSFIILPFFFSFLSIFSIFHLFTSIFSQRLVFNFLHSLPPPTPSPTQASLHNLFVTLPSYHYFFLQSTSSSYHNTFLFSTTNTCSTIHLFTPFSLPLLHHSLHPPLLHHSLLSIPSLPLPPPTPSSPLPSHHPLLTTHPRSHSPFTTHSSLHLTPWVRGGVINQRYFIISLPSWFS